MPHPNDGSQPRLNASVKEAIAGYYAGEAGTNRGGRHWKLSLDDMLKQIDSSLESAKRSFDFETVDALNELRRDVVAALGKSPKDRGSSRSKTVS